MIGDVVSNLRASLDHIAWALAQRQAEITKTPLTPSDERGISFPLGDILGNFSVSKCILPAAVDTIESFQPYNRTKRPELELLGVLDETLAHR